MAPAEAGTSSIALAAQQSSASPAEKKIPRASFDAVLTRQGVDMNLRQRQRIASDDSSQTYFFVRKGLLVLCANATAEPRQILALLYPGDAFCFAEAPPLGDVELVAMMDSGVTRIRRSALTSEANETELFDEFVARSARDLHARATLHIARLSTLQSESRVAAFLLEMGLRMGRVSGDQIVCDLPLTRCDIADYLSLNADTLSRIMTRLKDRGTIATIGRSRTIIKSIRQLCQDIPICGATIAIHQKGPVAVD